MISGVFLLATAAMAQRSIKVEKVATPAAPAVAQNLAGGVIFEGVEAGEFRPSLWKADTLNWVPDLQYPLLEAKQGRFRNIYSPSAVEEPWGWRFYYAGWDGITTTSDCIYESKTKDFLSFYDREMVVDHGDFLHTSNVIVQKIADGNYQMIGTAYIRYPGPWTRTNKPVIFHSKNGDSWNGDAIPYEARAQDVVAVNGYAQYDGAHLNGGHVMLQDGATTRFIFKNSFQNTLLFWAEGKDPAHITVGGVALKTVLSANDLRKFTVDGKNWYLMALYKKGDIGLGTADTDHLSFSLSNDGRTFAPPQRLIDARGDEDHYIFSDGFVTRGSAVIGVVYGAGDAPKDDKNKIFASWLQKKVVLAGSSGGVTETGDGALGPDMQRVTLPGGVFDGKLDLYDDDGKTLLGSATVHLEAGSVYRLTY